MVTYSQYGCYGNPGPHAQSGKVKNVSKIEDVSYAQATNVVTFLSVLSTSHNTKHKGRRGTKKTSSSIVDDDDDDGAAPRREKSRTS